MRHALFPGSFDPPTRGHLDLIDRMLLIFDRVTVAVIRNPNKQGLFSVQERLTMLEQIVKPQSPGQVQFTSFEGLLVDYVRELDYPVVVRGLRNSVDLEFEFQMTRLNRQLDHKVETVFLDTKAELSAISSSYVREIGRLGGEISFMLPEPIVAEVKARFGQISRPAPSEPS